MWGMHQYWYNWAQWWAPTVRIFILINFVISQKWYWCILGFKSMILNHYIIRGLVLIAVNFQMMVACRCCSLFNRPFASPPPRLCCSGWSSASTRSPSVPTAKKCECPKPPPKTHVAVFSYRIRHTYTLLNNSEQPDVELEALTLYFLEGAGRFLEWWHVSGIGAWPGDMPGRSVGQEGPSVDNITSEPEDKQ